MPYQPFDGPIPGENFTADTKNFPWHRPPQYTNMDDAIEAVIKKVMDDESSDAFLTMIEMGFSIVDVAQLLVQSGVGAGKWSVDFGILLAGPIAHILVIMCRGYGLEFDLGVDPTSTPPTSVFFKAASKIDPKRAAQVTEDLLGEEADAPAGAPPEENIPQSPEAPPTNAAPAPQAPPSGGLGGMPPQV